MSDAGSDVLVGADLGTSGLKLVAVRAGGELLARAEARYPTSRPEVGASEQDPADWLAALRVGLRELSAEVPTHRWAGLGLSGMIPTLVMTDALGTPVGPAITWEDARAEAQALTLRERVGAQEVYQRTGQWLDGRYLLPMLVRCHDADPRLLGLAAWAMGAKDYVFWWLTGTRATDPSTAAGYGGYGLRTGHWLPEILAPTADLLGGRMPALPVVLPSEHQARVSPGRARELGLPDGLSITLGAADSVLAALALGVRDPGEVAYVAGTSTVILGVTDTLVVDPEHRYLVTPLAGIDGWGLEMDLLATGSALRWLSMLFGCTEAEIVARSEGRNPATAPVFLPYLAPGEQGALWDPLLSGTITGLSLGHGQADVGRALLTGLILESRRCLEVIEEVTRHRGSVRIAGSSATSKQFQQDLADASGRQVLASDSTVDHSAVGAALIAARAVGLAAGYPQRPRNGGRSSGPTSPVTASPEHTGLKPQPDADRLWDALALRHDRALADLRGQR